MRGNASNNTTMLMHFKEAAAHGDDAVHHPWRFKVNKGHVRCIAHVKILAVQASLTTLKAGSEEDYNTYYLAVGCAFLPQRVDSNTEVASTLAELRRWA